MADLLSCHWIKVLSDLKFMHSYKHNIWGSILLYWGSSCDELERVAIAYFINHSMECNTLLNDLIKIYKVRKSTWQCVYKTVYRSWQRVQVDKQPAFLKNCYYRLASQYAQWAQTWFINDQISPEAKKWCFITHIQLTYVYIRMGTYTVKYDCIKAC